MLRPGDKAPTFKLACANNDGKAVSLNDFAGTYVVLYFYPKDDTPGCTRQAQAFTEMHHAFSSLGATVLGVSRDSVARHEKFQEKYDLRVPLLSDPDLVAHNLYGAFGTKKMYGRDVEGTIRSTFVIGPTGRIVGIFPKVRVEGHAEAVLQMLREAQGASNPVEVTSPVQKAAAPAKNTAGAQKSPAKKTKKPAVAAPAAKKTVAKKTVAKKTAAKKTAAKKTAKRAR